MFVFLFWLILAAFFALTTAVAAEGKGYDTTSWGFYGLIFGPFAMLAACALPDLKTRKILRSIAESQGVKFDFED